MGAVGLQVVMKPGDGWHWLGRDCRVNPRASAKEFPWRKERSQEGMVAESPVTQGPERVQEHRAPHRFWGAEAVSGG